MDGNQTRRQVLAGMATAGTALLAAGAIAGTATAAEEKHPRIHHAIEELREAKKELEKADHDFGGHRKKAIELIEATVEQLEKALKFAKK